MKQTHKAPLSSKAKVLLAVLLCVFVVCAAAALFARAGGGQHYSGGSRGSSGGSGEAQAIILVFRMFMFLIRLSIECPIIGIPLLCAFVWFLWWGTKRFNLACEEHEIETAAETAEHDAHAVIGLICKKIPDFSAANFAHRVTKAFIQIQSGWSDQNLGMAQGFLSDGIYEQFCIQIEELKSRGIIDFMQDLQVLDTVMVGFESDNGFDTIHIQINATAINYRKDKKTQKMIEGSKLHERSSEVWSFVRRAGVSDRKRKGGLMEGQCPNCGNPMKITRLQKCEICGAMLRSGQYDWVLTKITQACEWARVSNKALGLDLMLKADKGFNIQHMAERASVIFWRKIASDQTGNFDVLKKVSSERFFNEYSLNAKAEGAQRSFYINCGVGSIRIIAIELDKDFDKAYAEIVYSAQKASRQDDGSIKAQGAHITTKKVFVLIRKHGAQTNLDSALSASHCPTCGAPTQNTAENACPYCNNPLNDITKEWQLNNIVSPYSTLISEAIRRIKARPANGPIVTSLNAGRKTIADAEAIRWAVAMMLCDHEIDKAELEIIQALAKKTCVSNAKLSQILAEFQAVENTAEYAFNTTSITDGKLIMQEIAKVALADGKVTKEERQMLYSIASKLGYTKTNADALLEYMVRRLSRGRSRNTAL